MIINDKYIRKEGKKIKTCTYKKKCFQEKEIYVKKGQFYVLSLSCLLFYLQ